MMFQGTYTSDFYRAVRNLLHDQVSLEKLNVPGRSGEYRSVRRAIQQRWKNLLSREPLFRTASSQAIAVS
jgi:anaerobic magnesium-protoporphyrin IX monomethyl ester cyclase